MNFAVRQMGLCHYLLTLGTLRSYGILPTGSWYHLSLQQAQWKYEQATKRVSTPTGAYGYWLVAAGLSANGVSVDTSALESCSKSLPRIRTLRHPFSVQATDAFNYCTHAIIHSTNMFRSVDPSLQDSPYFFWLERFFRFTDMREDIEFLAEFLSCAGAAGWKECHEGEGLLLSIVEKQARSGCWPRSSRYDRFHSTWVATEALYLHRRILSGRNSVCSLPTPAPSTQ
jgi:hypothetical protein